MYCYEPLVGTTKVAVQKPSFKQSASGGLFSNSVLNSGYIQCNHELKVVLVGCLRVARTVVFHYI